MQGLKRFPSDGFRAKTKAFVTDLKGLKTRRQAILFLPQPTW
ncbi:hypothetical protein CT19431_140272 [Cupriavidus taiwanensis]|nr:hypothetical protein CT19431_140272 [Cupriavidus taiwanensis]